MLKGGLILIFLPLVTINFGTSAVALWLLFFSFTTLGMIFDFGFAPTFIRLFSYSRAQKNKPDIDTHHHEHPSIPQLIKAMRFIYGWLALVVVVVLAVGGTFGLMRPIAHTGLNSEAWLAWAYILFSIGSALLGQMYGAYLQGMDRIDVFRRNEILGYSLSIAAAYVGIGFFNISFLGLVILTNMGPVLNAIFHRWQAKKAGFVLSSSPLNHKVLVRIWSDAWRMGVGSVSLQGGYQIIGVFLGQIIAPAPLASYLIAHRLVQAISVLSSMPFYTNIPRMAFSFQEKDENGMYKTARAGVQQTLWLTTLGFLGLAVMGEVFFNILGGEVTFPPAIVWWLFALLGFSERYLGLNGQLILIGKKVIVHVANGVSAIAMLILVFPMTQLFGVTGAVLAMLLPLIIFNVPYSLNWVKKVHGNRFFRMVAFTAMPPFFALVAGACVIILAKSLF